MSTEVLDWSDVATRLAAAAAIGGAIGLNRDLHHKAAGVRTLGLVGLVGASITLGAFQVAGPQYTMPVIQGLLTGIGFLGAGVIVHRSDSDKVKGLTTAAAIWCTTAIGALCALGQWPVSIICVTLVFLILTFGGRLEKWVHGSFAGEKPSDGEHHGKDCKS